MARLRVLLLIGGEPLHRQPFHYAELASLLAGEGGADLRITDDLDVLNPTQLREYDVITNYTCWMEPSSLQVSALLEAVDGGVGFLGLHGATATFWNQPLYLDMIGSKFVRHDPLRSFRVHVDALAHPITAGVDDFTIEDELYELAGDRSTVDVLASGEGHPLLYVKTFGRGRVHYNALGHDQRALRHPAYRGLVLAGLAWTASRAGDLRSAKE